jgi:PAS domain S-box-containing protein
MWKSLTDRFGQADREASSAGSRRPGRQRTIYLIVVAIPVATAVITAGNVFLSPNHGIVAVFNLIVVSCIGFVVAQWFSAHRLLAKVRVKQAEVATARAVQDMLRAAEEAVRKAKQDKADELSNAAGALVRERQKAEHAREELNRQLAVAVANMSQGLLMFDANSRIVVCNERYIEMYGLSPEVVKPGLALRDLIVHRKEVGLFAGDVTQYCAAILASIKRGKTDSNLIETTDGRTIHIVNQPMAGGGWVSTHEDITERRRAELEINRTQKFLFKVIENVPAPITVKDARELRYILVNRAGEKFYGVPRSQIIGRTAHEIFPKATADLVVAHDRELLKTRQEMSFKEQVVDTPGGEQRIVLPRRMPVYGEDGEPQFLLGLFDDVTDRRKAEARLARLAHHDPLTDLPNRSAFTQHLEYQLGRAKRGGEKLAVLIADLDGIR